MTDHEARVSSAGSPGRDGASPAAGEDAHAPVPFNALQRRLEGGREIELIDAAARVLRSGWYVLGTEVEAFEREFAAYCGVPHAVGVANGSDALEIAIAALDLPTGSRIAVTPSAAMYATLAVLANGFEPAFVDIDAESSTIDPHAFERALGDDSIRAVIVTHLYGRLADMEPVLASAAARNVVVIEDCAQAHGAARDGRRAGAFGALGCFSFYPTKNLGAFGDGGAIVTSSAALSERVRLLRQYGWQTKYDVAVAHGRNSRLDELQAALLRCQLERLDAGNRRRRDIAHRYGEGIANESIRTPARRGDDDVAHLYVIASDSRDSLRAHCLHHGVRTDVHYPLADHRQRVFAGRYDTLRLPNADALARTALSLPCFPELKDHEVERVTAVCNAWTP